LKCGSSFCTTCIIEWTVNSIQNSLHGELHSIKCPSHSCSDSLLLDEVKSLLEPLGASAIQEIDHWLLKKYIIQSPDVLLCSRIGCSYAYIKDSACEDAEYEKFSCQTSNLSCPSCGFSPKSSEESFQREAKKMKDEFLSFIYEQVFSESCPDCSTNIIRDGGCNHMTCYKCKHEFCWVCKQDFNTHSAARCFSNTVSKYVLLSYILFHFLILIDVQMVRNVSKVFSESINIVIAFGMFLLLQFIVVCFAIVWLWTCYNLLLLVYWRLFGKMRVYYHNKRRLIKTLFVCAIVPIFLRSANYEITPQFINFTAAEVAIIVLFKLYRILYNRWLIYVA
jgi:hypothetical protein